MTNITTLRVILMSNSFAFIHSPTLTRINGYLLITVALFLIVHSDFYYYFDEIPAFIIIMKNVSLNRVVSHVSHNPVIIYFER